MRRASLGLVALAACGVVGLTAFFGVDAKNQAAPVPTRPTDSIVRCLEQLEDKNPAVRREAFDELVRRGPLTFDRTLSLRQHRDSEVNLRAFALHAACQKKHGVIPVRCGEAEIVPEGDTVWKRPAPGTERPIRIGLRVKNLGDKPMLFPVAFCNYMYMSYPAGDRKVRPGGGCDNPWEDHPPPVLIQPGTSRRISFDGSLESHEDGTCSFGRKNPDGGWMYFCDMKPGGYFVLFLCDNERPREADPREWRGHVCCERLTIVIE